MQDLVCNIVQCQDSGAMGTEPTPNDGMPTVTLEWLQGKLVGLLQDAMAGEATDHQACAKYCDLLFKLLPKGGKDVPQSVAAEIRRQMAQEAEAKQP